MKPEKLNICVLLQDIYDPGMPSRPEVIEIFGKYMPSFNHKVLWILHSKDKSGEIRIVKYKQVTLYTIPSDHESNLLSLIIDLFKYHVKEYNLLNKIFKENKYDLIHVRNDIFSGIIAIYFRHKYNTPFVFQYTFPQIDAHRTHKKYSFFFTLYDHLLKYVLCQADLVLPISEYMKKDLMDLGVGEEKMMSLPMGVNSELFSSTKQGLSVKSKYLLGNYKVCIYIGTLDRIRSLSTMIQAFYIVLKSNPFVKLVIVGDGSDIKNLKILSAELGITSNVIFAGQVPYFEVPDFIAASDICLSPIPPLDIFKISSPTKLFEYMAMGKPVVANLEISEQREVINACNCGILVTFQPESFAKGIIELLNNKTLSNDMGHRGKEWVIANRSYELMARELEQKYYHLF